MMALGVPHQEPIDIEQLRTRLDRLSQLSVCASTHIEPTSVAGIPGEWIRSAGYQPTRVIYYLHGGGYISGSPRTHRALTTRLARNCDARVLALDYRLAPEHPYPAALIDAWSGYLWLINTGIAPQQIIVMGDSAGGGLTGALLVALRDAGAPLPAAAVCLSPWFDLTLQSNSIGTNRETDFLCQAVMLASRHMYLNDVHPQTPLASPIYADLHGLPPILLQVGTAEMLLDDAVTFAHRATAAGVDVELQMWENMFHVWHFLFDLLPDARHAINSIGRFVRNHVHIPAEANANCGQVFRQESRKIA